MNGQPLITSFHYGSVVQSEGQLIDRGVTFREFEQTHQTTPNKFWLDRDMYILHFP